MKYVDGFVIPIAKKNIPAYRRMALFAGKIWMEYGALDFVECEGDDLEVKDMGVPFTKLAKAKPGETVLFSFITYKSRVHRDKVNANVMKDPRILKSMKKAMPFDVKRMSYGGFKTLVDLCEW